MTNYEDYSLKNLDEWLNDSMQSGATPEMIYSQIMTTIEGNIEYHTSCLTQATQLKRLIAPQPKTFDTDDIVNYQAVVKGLTTMGEC